MKYILSAVFGSLGVSFPACAVRSVFLSFFCFLVMASPACAGSALLSGQWQCHLVERTQYLCEFRHGDFRLQLIPRYLEDRVDIRVIDGGHLRGPHGRAGGGETCVPGMLMYLGARLDRDGMPYSPYRMSDMGHGACLYDMAARYDVDDVSSNFLQDFDYIDPNSIEYISEYIRRMDICAFGIYNFRGAGLFEPVFVPVFNKEYVIKGLSYWRRHRFEAKWLARRHPVMRHTWHCGWQKDGRLMCDVTAKDMHIMFYPKPDGKNVDVYIMAMLGACPTGKTVMGFTDEEVYFAANARWYDPLYTTGTDARPEKGLGGKWGCGYKLTPSTEYPAGEAAIDVLSRDIMDYDVIYGEAHDDLPPRGWATALELTDKAGLVHELQYWQRKNAEIKQPNVKQVDVKAVGQGAH